MNQKIQFLEQLAARRNAQAAASILAAKSAAEFLARRRDDLDDESRSRALEAVAEALGMGSRGERHRERRAEVSWAIAEARAVGRRRAAQN